MDIYNNIPYQTTSFIFVFNWAKNTDRLWAFLFAAISALCVLSTNITLVVVLTILLSEFWRICMELLPRSTSVSPELHIEPHWDAPLCTPTSLQLNKPTLLDFSSVIPIACVASVWLVLAHAVLSCWFLVFWCRLFFFLFWTGFTYYTPTLFSLLWQLLVWVTSGSWSLVNLGSLSQMLVVILCDL